MRVVAAPAQPPRVVGYVSAQEPTEYKDMTIGERERCGEERRSRREACAAKGPFSPGVVLPSRARTLLTRTPPPFPSSSPPNKPTGIPKETFEGERRVAATPATVEQMLKAGFRAVLVQKGAGAAADLPDAAFAQAGATLVDGPAQALSADVVLKVRPPTLDEAGMLKEGAALVSHIQPARNQELLETLKGNRATVVAMDCIPRQLSRAQTFDSLSSMANIAGYR
jgi:NAD(P) transhydrogenase